MATPEDGSSSAKRKRDGDHAPSRKRTRQSKPGPLEETSTGAADVDEAVGGASPVENLLEHNIQTNGEPNTEPRRRQGGKGVQKATGVANSQLSAHEESEAHRWQLSGPRAGRYIDRLPIFTHDEKYACRMLECSKLTHIGISSLQPHMPRKSFRRQPRKRSTVFALSLMLVSLAILSPMPIQKHYT